MLIYVVVYTMMKKQVNTKVQLMTYLDEQKRELNDHEKGLQPESLAILHFNELGAPDNPFLLGTSAHLQYSRAFDNAELIFDNNPI